MSRTNTLKQSKVHVSCEALESRELMYGVSFLGDTMVIEGFPDFDNVASVSLVNGKLGVSLRTSEHGYEWRNDINPDSVSTIIFIGSTRGDRFTNETSEKSTMYGYGGNDTLTGGNGQDTFYGGMGNDQIRGDGAKDLLQGDAGNDSLWGGAKKDVLRGGDGSDRLYGEQAADELFGEADLDSLVGGGGRDMLFGGVMDEYHPVIGAGAFWSDGQDILHGGTGADRLLLDVEDRVVNLFAEDARIVFDHGQNRTIDGALYTRKSWTNADVERMDWVFALLQREAGKTTLLETPSGSPMHFHRHGGSGRGWNFGSYMVLSDAQFTGGDDWLRGYVLHEIGHNWNGNQIGATRWQSFLDLSGWRSDGTYNPFAMFASNYATGSANEDWAESFAAHFLQEADAPWYAPWDGNGALLIPAKISLIAAWVESL